MLLQQEEFGASVSQEENSFNTASGRCCCNSLDLNLQRNGKLKVSIPQAVGVVATLNIWFEVSPWSYRVFQYRKR